MLTKPATHLGQRSLVWRVPHVGHSFGPAAGRIGETAGLLSDVAPATGFPEPGSLGDGLEEGGVMRNAPSIPLGNQDEEHHRGTETLRRGRRRRGGPTAGRPRGQVVLRSVLLYGPLCGRPAQG